MKHTLIASALALSAFATAAHAAQWIAVERHEVRITSYDRASIGHYDVYNPQYYFPKGEAIRGVVIRYRFLDVQPPNELKVDTREELTLFDCNNGTRVPVRIELFYRGVLDGRSYSPPQQLRNGFEPVIDRWWPAGSAIDKIYHAVCSANIAGRDDILVQ